MYKQAIHFLSPVGTPTIVSTVPLSSTTVVVAWEPQSGIDHYVVAFEYDTESQHVPCTGYEYNNTVSADGNDTQVTLTGLQEYFVYTFSLYAVVNWPGGAITSNSTTGGFTTLQAGIDNQEGATLQHSYILCSYTLLKMGSYSSTSMCQIWDNNLIY